MENFKLQNFGIEKFGTLKKVMLHKPVDSLYKVTKDNFQDYLFDKVPDIDKYLEEHDEYSNLLKTLGVKVFELQDHVDKTSKLLKYLPNLAYMHDSSVISSKGAIISKMCFQGRKCEDKVVKEALTNLGIPILHEFDDSDAFEGCLLLSPETVLVANTERHYKSSILKFISNAMNHFKEIIYVEIPKERRYMHPDMTFNRLGKNLALAYIPAFLDTFLITNEGVKKIDIRDHMEEKEVEIIEVSDNEQQLWATSFVPLKEKTIINYDISLSDKTINTLEQKGVDFIHFHPEALLAGGGSLRCLTLRLHREPV